MKIEKYTSVSAEQLSRSALLHMQFVQVGDFSLTNGINIQLFIVYFRCRASHYNFIADSLYITL